MTKQKVSIGGVPEHFNLPWHLAIENEFFSKEGLEVSWKDFYGGTGVMTKALHENEVDICVVLTEGIISSIDKGNPFKIIGPYVNTPLIWGVFTGSKNPINYYGEIYDKQYAISRFGSGSHLMALVDAYSKGFEIKENQWQVLNNLDGALAALSANKADVFYWEKYTTKPYVDNGTLKFLGEYVTPWPSFMIATTDKMIAENPEVLRKILNIIYFVNKQFMHTLYNIEMVSNRYKLDVRDVENWFHTTEWATDTRILTDKMFGNVLHTLKKYAIIKSEIDNEDIYCSII